MKQVASPRSAFLVCSSQQCNCIYFLHAKAQEDLKRGSSSQMSFKTGVLKILQSSEMTAVAYSLQFYHKVKCFGKCFPVNFQKKNAFLT